MQLSFKKNIKNLRKEALKQDNKENQVIEQMGNRLYQPEEEKFDEGIGKREWRGKGEDLGLNIGSNRGYHFPARC
jgi:hypothetical protein